MSAVNTLSYVKCIVVFTVRFGCVNAVLRNTFMIVKKRTCLKCNKSFQSEGPSNRICGICSNHNRKVKFMKEQLPVTVRKSYLKGV